jgi:hypothetical protein
MSCCTRILKKINSKNIEEDDFGKAKQFALCSIARPHMRSFHSSWFCFAISSPDIVFLGPNLSHSGPMITRMAIVAVTLAIPELAKSNFDRCNSLLIVGSNGWMLNHDVNAAKKQNHEEWKLRMCGRAILHNANYVINLDPEKRCQDCLLRELFLWHCAV